METQVLELAPERQASSVTANAAVFTLSGQRWLLGLAFGVYATVLALTICHHEPWADEAQAWLMARDLSPFDLFVRYLRYEGTPGLWHLILMGPAKAGLPYFSLSLISGIIAAGGILLFLTCSKIPLMPRLLLPFSFFLLYQYAVVARSYVLMPALLFAIAAIYRDRARRIWLFTLLLCLLANTNLHGMMITLWLAMIYALEARREWCAMETACRRRHVAALAVFGTVISLLILQLFPPSDTAFATGLRPNTIDCLIFQGKTFWPDSLTLHGVPWFSVPVLALSLVWFWRHQALWEYALPVGGLLLFFALKHVAAWHQGVLFLLWVFAVWIGCERHSVGIARGGARLRILDKVFPGVIVFVAAVGIWWSVRTIQCDLTGPYSGSRAAAAYIKAHNLRSKPIFLTNYHDIALLPYFQDNIYANLNDGRKPAFWWWSTSNPLVQEKRWPAGNIPKIIGEIRSRQPDTVIAGITGPKEKVVIPVPGYVRVSDCDGSMYWKGTSCQGNTFFILRRADSQPPGAGSPSAEPTP